VKGTTVAWIIVGIAVVVGTVAIIAGAISFNNDLRDRCEQLGGVYLTRGEKCVQGIEGWSP
jgi:hypothetical protein